VDGRHAALCLGTVEILLAEGAHLRERSDPHEIAARPGDSCARFREVSFGLEHTYLEQFSEGTISSKVC